METNNILLSNVFKDGQIMVDSTLEAIRDRANSPAKEAMPV